MCLHESLDLATLYRNHVRDVARWAARLAGPEFDLPDMVHEVFEIAQRRLPTFRHEAQPSTWLFAITEKVVRHRRRKDRIRHWLVGSANDVGKHMPAVSANQSEDLERRERIQGVYRVLDRLPERDREVLIMFELEDMSGEEIAALLDIKVSNVWLRLHRARERFMRVHEKMEREIGEPARTARRQNPSRYGHAGK
jgi:RNA polymerase sigma-70 factor (ECF subfamily)